MNVKYTIASTTMPEDQILEVLNELAVVIVGRAPFHDSVEDAIATERAAGMPADFKNKAYKVTVEEVPLP